MLVYNKHLLFSMQGINIKVTIMKQQVSLHMGNGPITSSKMTLLHGSPLLTSEPWIHYDDSC